MKQNIDKVILDSVLSDHFEKIDKLNYKFKTVENGIDEVEVNIALDKTKLFERFEENLKQELRKEIRRKLYLTKINHLPIINID